MCNMFLTRSGMRCGVSQWVTGLFLFLLMSACFASSLPAGEVDQTPLPPCAYNITPTGTFFTFRGGAGSVWVSVSTSSCSWTAVSNAAWITITSGLSGTGSGTVAYSVPANTGTSERYGTMTIAGRTFTVGQSPSWAKSITVAPRKLSLSKNGGNGDVTVTVKAIDNRLMKGVTVTARLVSGYQIIHVSPTSQPTDANGQAVFAVTAKRQAGVASIRFRAFKSKPKFVTVQVR